MTEPTVRDIIPLLQQFGITPDQLGADRVEKLMELMSQFGDLSQITPEVASNIASTLGIEPNKPKIPKKRTKIGRNEKCPCKSGKKWKKCCLKN